MLLLDHLRRLCKCLRNTRDVTIHNLALNSHIHYRFSALEALRGTLCKSTTTATTTVLPPFMQD